MNARAHSSASTGTSTTWPSRVMVAASVLIITIALCVLLGWATDIDLLKRMRVGFVAMNPTTAVGLLIAGAALLSFRATGARRLGLARSGAGLAMALIGVLRLVRVATGSGVQIDQWLLPRGALESTGAVNAMAPNTAVMFVLAGASLAFIDTRAFRRVWIGESLGLLLATLSTLAICGYLYGSHSLYGVGSFIPMALPTAIAFLAFSVAIVCARPDRPFMSQLLSHRPGGMIARRALPGIVVIMLCVGYLRQLGESRGFYAMDTGVSLMTCANLVLIFAMVVIIAGSLNRVDAAREHLSQQAAAAQKTIEANHELMTAILRNIADGVIVVNSKGELLHANPAAQSLMGRTDAGHNLQRTGSDRLCGDQDAPALAPDELALVRAAQGQTVVDQEQFLRNADGPGGRWFSASAQPLEGRGGGAVVIVRDITARKLVERRLEDANEALEAIVAERTANLTRSNQDLQQFAYVASHDLQEPLRMIASYLQLLERRHKANLDDQAREFIAFAVDGANRMKQLILDLLQYSRVDSRGGTLVTVESTNAVREARQSLAASINEARAEVIAEDLPAITADPVQLRQLFQNLIGNAVKFRGSEPPRIVIKASREGSEWRFSVTDNGIGIEARYVERIFEVFQRLHTREQYAGTGIGLAICKKIVERHGGRIWVEPAPEGGSTFVFTIPDKEKAHAHRRAA